MKTEKPQAPERLYDELGALNEAGQHLWATMLDGAELLARELDERGIDLRDARQVATDAVSSVFADRIQRAAYRRMRLSEQRKKKS